MNCFTVSKDNNAPAAVAPHCSGNFKIFEKSHDDRAFTFNLEDPFKNGLSDKELSPIVH
jgi:hypothetical protein